MLTKKDFGKKFHDKEVVVYRVDGEYCQHAHVANSKTANILISLLCKGVMPRSEYLKGSAKRLLNKEEYERLKDDSNKKKNMHK